MPGSVPTSTETATAATDPVVVGVADLAVVRGGGKNITTYALGSCIGFTAYDPETRAGALLHYMLPQPGEGADAKGNEAMYGSTGIPKVFAELERLGAKRERLVLVAAGAAEVISKGRQFAIGQRNRTILRKLLWKLGLNLAAEDTGGNEARTMSLDLSTGTVRIRGRGKETVLWQP
jgi:chemotaxis protein CheD